MKPDHGDAAPILPAALVQGAAITLLVVVIMVAMARVADIAPLGAGASLGRAPSHEVSLTFLEANNGELAVASGSGAVLAQWEPADAQFVRGVLRALRRQRLVAGVEGPMQVQLTSWDTGGLTLTDNLTGQPMELGAFGPDNAGVFATLLRDALAADAP